MIVDKVANVYCIDTMINNEKDAVCCYIINSEKACIVDCGSTSTANEILNAIDELGISRDDVRYIAVTHIHLDHGGGAGRLLKYFKNAKVLVHPKGFKHLINPLKLWNAAKSLLGDIAEIYQAPEPCEESKILAVKDMQTIDLGDCKLMALHTPGHAVHHVSFYLSKHKTLFTGDSAGMQYNGMIVPTTPPPFDFNESLKSLEKMMELNPKIIAFTHFGFGKSELLKKVYKKIVEWVDIAKEVVSKGGDAMDLQNKILELDSEFRELLNLYKNSRIVKESYMLGFLGLIKYVKGG